MRLRLRDVPLALVLSSPAILWAQKAAAPRSPYPATAEHPGPAWFVDVASKAGILVRDVNGDPEIKKYIIETTGSGVAILDYDNDGWPDIFLVNGTVLPSEKHVGDAAPTNHLFHNNHDGTFTDVTAKAGLVSTGWGQGACVGDYDNDGYPDLYVTGYGKNRLFHNQGDGIFREVAEQTGTAGTGKEWGTGCAFVDYDRDGKLDLMVANYVHFDAVHPPEPGSEADCMWKGTPVMCGPRGLPNTTNILYHNEGNGTFRDVSASSGIQKTLGHYCFSVTTLDYNEDGWPDIYIACDSTPAILYRNITMARLRMRRRMRAWRTTKMVENRRAWDRLLRTMTAMGTLIFSRQTFPMTRQRFTTRMVTARLRTIRSQRGLASNLEDAWLGNDVCRRG